VDRATGIAVALGGEQFGNGRRVANYLLPAVVHARSIIEPVADFEENQRHSRIGGRVYWQRVFAATLVVLSWTAVAQCKDLALISNKSNSVPSMTLPELAKVCKGQVSRWPDGKAVSFVTRDPTAPEMKLLLEKVYAMSKDEVKTVIANANHGRTNHPAIVVVESDDDVVKKVESIPGAVGLVDVYSIGGGVKVLKVGGKLPLEPGYPLHGN
jgi:hypothetical protein